MWLWLFIVTLYKNIKLHNFPPTTYYILLYLGVPSKKKNSIFVDIAHIGGGEVNPMSTKNYNIIFWQKEERRGPKNYFMYDFCPKICVCTAM